MLQPQSAHEPGQYRSATRLFVLPRTLDDLRRGALGVHGVRRDDTALEIEKIEQRGQRRDLVRFLPYRDLAQHKTRLGREGLHHHQRKRSVARDVEWLLIEWPEGEDEPAKYWLSTMPENTELQDLVDLAKLRWRIERDYQDLKQEIGLGHYEGRGWRGFHHHATLAIAAYGFLICEADAISPSGAKTIKEARRFQSKTPHIPKSFKPRGTPIAA